MTNAVGISFSHPTDEPPFLHTVVGTTKKVEFMQITNLLGVKGNKRSVTRFDERITLRTRVVGGIFACCEQSFTKGFRCTLFIFHKEETS